MKKLMFIIAPVVLVIGGLCIILSPLFSCNTQPLRSNQVIAFDTCVHTDDLNSSDVFRILARKGDTIILTYYY